MSEHLDYVIDVRGGKRSANEVKNVSKWFDKFGNSISEADKAAGRFIDTQGRMRESNGALVKSVDKVSTSVGRGSSSITTFGGRVAFLGRVATPVIGALATLGPVILAVGASAAAAVTGAGIVGGAGLLALGASLGGVGGIAMTMFGQLDKVRSAQEQLNLTIEQYGANSTEAVDAQMRFHAVLAQNGGAPMLKLLERLNRLTERWTKATGRARGAVRRIVGSGLGLAEKLLPTVARETNRGAGALRGAVSNTTRQLGGREMQGNITAFGKAGSQVIPQIAAGLTDVFFALLRLLRPAIPYVVQAAEAFRDWAHDLREAAGDEGKLSGFISMLVGHFKQWWDLATSLGDTLRILFGASEESGKGFVESLTILVDKFNIWLESAKQSGELKRYFDDFVGLFATIVEWIATGIKYADWLWKLISLSQTSVTELKGIAELLIQAFKDIGPAIGDAFSGMWDGIKEGFRSAMNWIIEKWNNFRIGTPAVKAWGKTIIPGFAWDTPDIPLMAEGGTVRMGGAAVVGEEGPEMLNLPAGAQVTPLQKQPAAPARWPDIVLKVDRRTLTRVLGSDIEAQMARGG